MSAVSMQNVMVGWIKAQGDKGGWLVAPDEASKQAPILQAASVQYTPPGFAETQVMNFGKRVATNVSSETFGTLSITYTPATMADFIPVGEHLHFEIEGQDTAGGAAYDQLTHCLCTAHPQRSYGATGNLQYTQTFSVTGAALAQATARLLP